MSDYTVVYFTGLKRGISVPSTLCSFKLFGSEITIKWYGVLITIGFILGLVAAMKLAKKQKMNTDKLFDTVIYGTLFSIIGARLYFVVFHWDYYSKNPGDIIRINEGGLAIYGGLIFAILAAWIVCKIQKTSILKVLDVTSVGFLIGQGIGRWGNFTNQEAFGTNTTAPWGMTSEKVQDFIMYSQAEFTKKGFHVNPEMPVHPTFLYESIWCIIGAIILYIICSKYKKFDGQIILSYAVWYGLERAVVEGLRTDSLYIGTSTIRVSQLVSAIIVVVGLLLLVYNFIKLKKNPKPVKESIESSCESDKDIKAEVKATEDKAESEDIKSKEVKDTKDKKINTKEGEIANGEDN